MSYDRSETQPPAAVVLLFFERTLRLLPHIYQCHRHCVFIGRFLSVDAQGLAKPIKGTARVENKAADGRLGMHSGAARKIVLRIS